MSDLTNSEKRKLERMLRMQEGYVLAFTNRTFRAFILESSGKEIYDDKYKLNSGSKANRMRAFWNLESNFTVGKLLDDIFKDWDYCNDYSNPEAPNDECLRIVQRLKLGGPVPNIDVVVANPEDKDFETLAKAVRGTIDRNEPEQGLDRLHTYLMVYFRAICKKYVIDVDKKKPLHSLVGMWVKKIDEIGAIESEMTRRILKASISVMEAFNDVRNNQSLAHDNKILNSKEAMLIFSHVTSTIQFIEHLEKSSEEPSSKKPVEY
jgi:hypothetical protein